MTAVHVNTEVYVELPHMLHWPITEVFVVCSHTLVTSSMKYFNTFRLRYNIRELVRAFQNRHNETNAYIAKWWFQLLLSP